MRYFPRFLFLFLLTTTQLFAQKKVSEKVKEKRETIESKAKKAKQDFLYSGIKEPQRYMCLKAQANTNGWSGGIMYGRRKNAQFIQWYALSFGEIKHDKEEKIKPNTYEVQGYGKPLPYIYGKQNSFYQFNIGYAQERLLLKGFILPSVNVSLVYGINFSLGLLKPYYLQIKKVNNGILSIEQEKYSLANADTFLANSKIYSRSKFGYGLKETKLIPGLHVHVAGQFDVGSGAWLKAIRIGASASVYSQKAPLMVDQKQHSYFLNLFMGVVIGRGW